MASAPQNSGVQPSNAHRIGEHLYRKWRKPNGDFWYEVYFVVRKTRTHVDVKGFMEEHLPAIRLDRARLERSGSAASIRHQAVFYTEMPEEYRKQTLGYLAMENGIYAFGLAFAVEEPLLVEMGVLLDVFVGVFVMGIAIHHISREFDHIDTDRLSELKD